MRSFSANEDKQLLTYFAFKTNNSFHRDQKFFSLKPKMIFIKVENYFLETSEVAAVWAGWLLLRVLAFSSGLSKGSEITFLYNLLLFLDALASLDLKLSVSE